MNPTTQPSPLPVQSAAHKGLVLTNILFSSFHHASVLLFQIFFMYAVLSSNSSAGGTGAVSWLLVLSFFPWAIGAIATTVINIIYLAVVKPRGIALGLTITSLVAVLLLPIVFLSLTAILDSMN